MTHQAANFSGAIPENYDRLLGPWLFADFAKLMAERVARRGAKRVLEIAAGTGIVTRQLRDALAPGARLMATDLNAPMLEVARRKFAADDQIEFQTADAEALPFPDAAFDAVVCQFGVMFYPNKQRSYAEAHRVLAPGGRYFFSVWDSHRRNRLAALVHETIGGFFLANPPQFYQVPYGYSAIDPIKDALIDGGFTDISIAVVRQVRDVVDLPGFARGLVYGNPVSEQIRASGNVDPDQVVAAIQARLGEEFGGGPARIPMQIICFEARTNEA